MPPKARGKKASSKKKASPKKKVSPRNIKTLSPEKLTVAELESESERLEEEKEKINQLRNNLIEKANARLAEILEVKDSSVVLDRLDDNIKKIVKFFGELGEEEEEEEDL